MSQNGMVACANPLASLVGVNVLQNGGNAMDASVAMNAALNVLDPAMCGIGGDAFFLYYAADKKKLFALNASGRSPSAATLESYNSQGIKEMPAVGPLSVTVPGGLDGWVKGLERFGSKPLSELLQPAIRYAEEGFPVNPMLNFFYRIRGRKVLSQFPESAAVYLPNGEIPATGQVLKQPDLARSLRMIGEEGSDVFYKGRLGKQVVAALRKHGGLMTEEDLAAHTSDWIEPISTSYGGTTVYELPPSTQGIALLQQLNVLSGYDFTNTHPESADKLHLQIEAAKLAFSDLHEYITDPEFADIPVSELLSEEYAAKRRALIDPAAAAKNIMAGLPEQENTTYITVVDRHGNVSSFINSLRNPFGSGLVAEGTGILMQNRGKDFSLDPDSANRLAPNKRTMHTLNPIMVFKEGVPLISLGCVGGHQQTQGLQQFLLNYLVSDYPLQQAIEAPRWSLSESGEVHIEPALAHAKEALEALGHEVVVGKTFFGAIQAVRIDPESQVRFGGSDPRLDGIALGY
ncbi:gamma-glutamyltransferase [Marinobacter sp.]|uniref:gamma-glutamyltransferase n=1 Tax=Marinobacter sp. TaxID=50741 RepID=UPI00384CA611